MIKSQETGLDRDAAAALDSADVLAQFRERFVLADDGVVYLDGNSLGRLPRATLARLSAVAADEWGRRLVRAWDEGWMELPVAVGDRLGESLLGAARAKSSSATRRAVCFYKLAWAALDARPGRTEIVTDVDNFPTDRYVLEGLARARGCEVVWLRGDPCAGPTPEAVADLVGERTALVTFSHVSYRSAHIAEMAADLACRPRCGRAGAVGSQPQRRLRARRARRDPARISLSAARTSI